MNQRKEGCVVIHGWKVYVHPLFIEKFEALAREVSQLRLKDPIGYTKKNAAKRYAAITKLAFDVIPQDPTRPEYRLGGTLGEEHKHWFRAKFFQQYRLFFRFHASSRTIVLGWVNDENTKRAYESNSDAYKVFKRMLSNGQLPKSWEELLAEARAQHMGENA